MARPAYSTAFIHEQIIVDGFTEYVVPDGYIVVLRDLDVIVEQGLNESAQVTVTTEGITFQYVRAPPGPNVIFQWQGRQVKSAGTVISAEITSLDDTAVANVLLSGYLLTVS